MTSLTVVHQELPVSSLDLDTENPRHGPVSDQSAALARLIGDQRDKLVRIAVDIHDHGLSPAQLFIVTPATTGRFTVLDGNRRLAALRILDNARLLTATLHSDDFARVTSGTRSHPTAVLCAVVPNRDEARLWLERSHGGQLEGIGPVPWSSAAKYRFNPDPLSRGHTANAIRVLDWIRRRLEDDDPAHTNLNTVESDSVTNLGRLASDPDIRHIIGFDFNSGTVALKDDDRAVVRRLLRVIEDLVGDTTVTQLKNKLDRAKYVTELLATDTYETPDSGSRDLREDSDASASAEGEQSATTAAGDASASERTQKTKRSTKPIHPLADIDTSPLHPRIQSIMDEVRKLNRDKFPNAVAVLLRAIIELTVTEYLQYKGNIPGQNTKLPTKIRRAMRILGITEKDAEFQPLQTKLKDRNSIISVPNLHQYVHNVNALPGKSDLDSIAFAYRPLLERICSDLSGQQSMAV